MKMGHEGVALCYKPDDIFRKEVRFNGRNAVALDACYLVQLPDKIIKTFIVHPTTIRTFTKVTQVYTGQNNFFYTILRQLPGLLHHVFNKVAAAAAPCH